MVMNGLCTGLGDENGFIFGDFGEGTTSGGGIVKFGRLAGIDELIVKPAPPADAPNPVRFEVFPKPDELFPKPDELFPKPDELFPKPDPLPKPLLPPNPPPKEVGLIPAAAAWKGFDLAYAANPEATIPCD